MLTTMHREPSLQPAAAVAAKDRATVELVLQKVYAHCWQKRHDELFNVQGDLR